LEEEDAKAYRSGKSNVANIGSWCWDGSQSDSVQCRDRWVNSLEFYPLEKKKINLVSVGNQEEDANLIEAVSMAKWVVVAVMVPGPNKW
jgi:hypothetical protein